MAYTDLSNVFQYKSLLTHQRMDQVGENDKVFNDLLNAVTDFDNNLNFNNAKYLQGEIAAGSTYKKLIGLDASNIVQLGESGTEVRVPADPSNALGVATKQYVDNTLMTGLISKVRVEASSAVNADLVNISAVGRVIYITQKSSVSGNGRSTLTLDGTSYGELSSIGTAETYYGHNRTSDDATTFAMSATEQDIGVRFRTSLRLQYRTDLDSGTNETVILYERNA